jgi:hypothetical protein
MSGSTTTTSDARRICAGTKKNGSLYSRIKTVINSRFFHSHLIHPASVKEDSKAAERAMMTFKASCFATRDAVQQMTVTVGNYDALLNELDKVIEDLYDDKPMTVTVGKYDALLNELDALLNELLD